jgi:thiamine kinase-like enzyme
MQYILCVNNRYFKIDIADGEFLKFLENESLKDFNDECINEKDLIVAYIKKVSELYEKEKKLDKLLEKLELDLSKTSV